MIWYFFSFVCTSKKRTGDLNEAYYFILEQINVRTQRTKMMSKRLSSVPKKQIGDK